jgi:hypothetical protein
MPRRGGQGGHKCAPPSGVVEAEALTLLRRRRKRFQHLVPGDRGALYVSIYLVLASVVGDFFYTLTGALYCWTEDGCYSTRVSQTLPFLFGQMVLPSTGCLDLRSWEVEIPSQVYRVWKYVSINICLSPSKNLEDDVTCSRPEPLG